MYKRKDSPKVNDYVICTVNNISDVDVKVSLDEYENFNGIIPIDELSNRRITNPKILVREVKRLYVWYLMQMYKIDWLLYL